MMDKFWRENILPVYVKDRITTTGGSSVVVPATYRMAPRKFCVTKLLRIYISGVYILVDTDICTTTATSADLVVSVYTWNR